MQSRIVFNNLYENKTLQYWHSNYSEKVQWIFEEFILQKLTEQEFHVLGDTHLHLPLILNGESYDNGFACYVYEPFPVVKLPMFSIKFFYDLSIAYSWFETNGSSQHEIVSYVTALTNTPSQQSSSENFQTPLKALNIPEYTKLDDGIANLSQKALKNIIVLILSHEMAHILYGHGGDQFTSKGRTKNNTLEADRFALEIFRRNRMAPIGIPLYFLVMAACLQNRNDYKSKTNPVSKDRLLAIAKDIIESTEDFASSESDMSTSVKTVVGIANALCQVEEMLKPSNRHIFPAWNVRPLMPEQETQTG